MQMYGCGGLYQQLVVASDFHHFERGWQGPVTEAEHCRTMPRCC